MTEIALIGAGNLGSRHLQALAKLSRPARVTVIDPSSDALERAAGRFAETASHGVTPIYARSLEALDTSLDVVIVATNADVRADLIRHLMTRARVGAFLLEKVLFTRAADYAEIGSLLARAGTKAWVNCARRSWPSYRAVRQRLASSRLLELNASGSDWGLACNSIHFLDLAAWLGGATAYKVVGENLDSGTRPAKRASFVEFTGALSGNFDRGPMFRISSWQPSAAEGMPFVLQVIADDVIYIIREEENLAWVADARSSWAWNEIPFHSVPQSELTHLIVEEILDRGTAPLTPYADSAALHAPMLGAFMRHLQSENSTAVLTSCPIT